jgi:hypothetical protein
MQVRTDRDGDLSMQHVCSRETASDLVHEIVELGNKRTGRVVVVGCEHIELLIQLARHGFVDVTYSRMLAGPHAGETAVDIIIAPAADREPEFPAVLSPLTSGLRPGGVLFFGTAGALLMTRKRQIQALLIQQGLHSRECTLGPPTSIYGAVARFQHGKRAQRRKQIRNFPVGQPAEVLTHTDWIHSRWQQRL